MNYYLLLIITMGLFVGGFSYLADWFKKTGLRVPRIPSLPRRSASSAPQASPESPPPPPVSTAENLPPGMVRLVLYTCPRCGRRNRLKAGLDPRYARCGRCFAEMASAKVVGEEIAPEQPDIPEDPKSIWVLRSEDLPRLRTSPGSRPIRTTPRFEIPQNPLPEEIHWKRVDPHQTTLTGRPEPHPGQLIPEQWPDVIGNIDPVTGTALQAGDKVFICTHCTTAYHAQTWDYLQEQNAGACPSCNRQNTIIPYPEAARNR